MSCSTSTSSATSRARATGEHVRRSRLLERPRAPLGSSTSTSKPCRRFGRRPNTDPRLSERLFTQRPCHEITPFSRTRLALPAVFGFPDAGQAGKGPFRTYLRRSMSPQSIEKDADEQGLTSGYRFSAGKAPSGSSSRGRLPRLVWGAGCLCYRAATLGRLDPMSRRLSFSGSAHGEVLIGGMDSRRAEPTETPPAVRRDDAVAPRRIGLVSRRGDGPRPCSSGRGRRAGSPARA
jgi:hypothetical protein